ncbi:MAG: hypothetical protein K2X38_12585 [Gemmataceae bacterium]|nr:hypothetical protein [Gemmataceae bacterium]
MHLVRQALLGLACIAGLLLVAPSAFSQETKTPDPSQLVEKLGDGAFAAREGAYRKLLSMGKDAAEAVKAGMNHPNAEVRRRCVALHAVIGRPVEDHRWDAFIGKKTEESPAGWEKFRDAVGDDATSRSFFVKMHQADAELMNLLVKDLAKASALIGPRTVKLQQKIGRMQQEGALFDPFPEFLAIMHAANTTKAKVDLNSQYQICNLFHQQGIHNVLRSSPIGKKLMSVWLTETADMQVQRNQAPYLASNFQLGDVVQKKLRPMAEAMVKEFIAAPDDMNKFYQAINMCQVLKLTDVMESQMKPVVRKKLEAALKEPIDINKINIAVNASQSLQMANEVSASLKPAVMKLAENAAKGNVLDPGQMNQFFTVLNLANSIQAPDIVDSILRPAGQRALIEGIAKTNDVNQMFQMINLSQQLQLQELAEPLMKPAADRIVRKMIQNREWANLQQALSLTQQVGLRVEDLDKAIRDGALEAIEKRQPLQQVYQAVQLTRQVGGDPASEKKIEASLKKLFTELSSKPIQTNDIYQGLQLAREWNLTEGMEFAVKAATTTSVPVHARGQALGYIAQGGSKDLFPKLEALLEDKASFGRTNINAISLETQIRDAALMAMVCIANQDHESYGFAAAQMMRNQNPGQLPPNWWGFRDDAARNKAIEKWREFRKKG